MSLPNPEVVYYELQKAIREDKRPCVMLREFLISGSVSSNIINNAIFGNKRALALLTSPQGRAWLHKWMDDFLNYLEVMSKQ